MIFSIISIIFSVISLISDFISLCQNIINYYKCRPTVKFRKQNLEYVPFPGRLQLRVFRKNFSFLQHEMVHKHGPVFGTRFLGNLMIIVSVPEIAHTVLRKELASFVGFKDSILNSFLSTDDDKLWKSLESIVMPNVCNGELKQMKPWIDVAIESLMKNFEESLKKSPNINAKELYGAFTIDIITQVVFGTKVESLVDNRDKKKFFLKVIRDKRKELKDVKNVGKANNIIELLLRAEAEKNEKLQTEEKSIETNGNSNNKTVKFMSNDEMIAQCILFFTATCDTTTSTISLASYFLALNLEMQDRLYQEVETTLEKLKQYSPDQQNYDDPTSLITPESLSQFKYLEAFIKETLRMYPPADLERTASKDMKLETENGSIIFDVKKGDIIHFPVYAMHHDPTQFPEPNKFEPERFLNKPTFYKYAYLPFGSGPRKCVARNITLWQVKLALINVVHRFKLSTCEQTKIPMEFYNNRPLLTPKEVFLRIEKRL